MSKKSAPKRIKVGGRIYEKVEAAAEKNNRKALMIMLDNHYNMPKGLQDKLDALAKKVEELADSYWDNLPTGTQQKLEKLGF